MTEKDQAKKDAKRKQAALKCAAKLDAAIEAMNEFLRACRECNDAGHPERNGIADSRIVLIGNMAEYSTYLSSRFSKD